MPSSTRPWQPGQPSATAIVIALSAAAASAQWLFTLVDRGEILHTGAMTEWLGLSTASLIEGHSWQLLTFMFAHAGPFPLHLAASLIVLYFAGREVEPILGTGHFLGLFFGGNFVGALAHIFAGAQGWIAEDQLLLGTSAGAVAMLAGFSTVLPQLEVPYRTSRLMPFQFQARFLGIFAAIIAAVLWFFGIGMVAGPEAMIAGAFFGWVYVKGLGFGSPLPFQRYFFDKHQREARLSRMPLEQFMCEEIDPILDKIASEGMHSLTRMERKILDRCREKLAAEELMEEEELRA